MPTLGNNAASTLFNQPKTGGVDTLETPQAYPGNFGGSPGAGPSTGGLNPSSPILDNTGGTPDIGGGFTGGSQAYLNSLYNARPQFIAQQGDLLSSLGPSLRSAIFSASPELATTANYFQQNFNDPFGGSLSTFQDAIRGAQAARGFGGGGSGPAGEEARYLTNFAEQRRMALAPQMAQFGQALLGNSGLAQPSQVDLSTIGGLTLQSQQLQAQIKAGQAESQQSKTLYQQYLDIIKKSGSSAAPPSGKNNPFAPTTTINVGSSNNFTGPSGFFENNGGTTASPFNPYNL